MEFSKDFEETLIKAIKEALDGCSIDLLSDMVRDNPEWWSETIRKFCEDTIKKALQDDRLIKQIIQDILGDYLSDIDLEVIASDIIEDKIKNSILDKITVEVKK